MNKNKVGIIRGVLLIVLGGYLAYIDLYPRYQINNSLISLGFEPLTVLFTAGLIGIAIGFVMVVIYSLEGKSLMNPY